MAECKHDWVDVSTHSDMDVKIFLCHLCKATKHEPLAMSPGVIEYFPDRGMQFTWENLLAYLRWQSQREELRTIDNAYLYADFDGESIGLDGHLSRETLEKFLESQAHN